jgi:hypothetical protein
MGDLASAITSGGLVALGLVACSRPTAPARGAGAVTPPSAVQAQPSGACREEVALSARRFSPDGAHFLIEPEPHDDGEGLAFALCEAASRQQTASPTTTLGGIGTASWSGDSRSFVVVANFHTGPAEAHLWDARRRVHVAESSLSCFEEVEWAARSSWVALGGCEMGVALLRTDGSTWRRPFEGGDGAASQQTRLVARSGDTRLVYLIQDGRFESWDVSARPPVRVRAIAISPWSTIAVDRARGRFTVEPVDASMNAEPPAGPKHALLEVYDLDTGARLGETALGEPAKGARVVR